MKIRPQDMSTRYPDPGIKRRNNGNQYIIKITKQEMDWANVDKQVSRGEVINYMATMHYTLYYWSLKKKNQYIFCRISYFT